MNIKQITNELRLKVVEKLQTVLHTLQINTSAEMIENQCFEKSDNNADLYVKMCHNFITSRTKSDMSLLRGSPMQNYRPNVAGTSNNGTPSDPINALQNLTVTAGQPNQMIMQQTNSTQQMNARINNNMFPGQIRQRLSSTVPSTNMQRPMEQQFPMSQSPITQITQPQMQQGHNMINTNNIRLITKNVQNSPMSIYQVDNSNGTPIAGQQMLGQPMVGQQITVQQIPNNVRPQLSRMVNNSPAMPNTQPMQAQTQVYQDQYSNVKQNPATPLNNSQSDDMNSQTPTSNQINNSNVSTTPSVSVPQNPPSAPVKVPVTEEEAFKVKDELVILSERYLKYIKLVLENPEFISGEQNMKVWVTLRSVLDDPRAMNKNISLKHVARIQDFCEKAEKIVQQNNLEKSKPTVLPKSEELFGKRVIPDRNRTSAVVADMVTTGNVEVTGPTNNASNSLDVAFDDVIHQLKKKDSKLMKTIQKNLVKFVRNNPNFLHYLPRNLQIREEDSNYIACSKPEIIYDEHEFDRLDDVVIEGFEHRPPKRRNRAVDQYGMLRTDIDTSSLTNSELGDADSELDLVRGEFQVQRIEDQVQSASWCTRDDIWEQGTFYAISYKGDSLSGEVPAIVVRVPSDYDHSGSIDWNLNLDLYSYQGASNLLFLADVRHAVEEEFIDLATRYHWTGVNLLQALSAYKRGIQTGFSNYECRQAMS